MLRLKAMQFKCTDQNVVDSMALDRLASADIEYISLSQTCEILFETLGGIFYVTEYI